MQYTQVWPVVHPWWKQMLTLPAHRWLLRLSGSSAVGNHARAPHLTESDGRLVFICLQSMILYDIPCKVDRLISVFGTVELGAGQATENIWEHPSVPIPHERHNIQAVKQPPKFSMGRLINFTSLVSDNVESRVFVCLCNLQTQCTYVYIRHHTSARST